MSASVIQEVDISGIVSLLHSLDNTDYSRDIHRSRWQVPLKPAADHSTQHPLSKNYDGFQAFFCIIIYMDISHKSQKILRYYVYKSFSLLSYPEPSKDKSSRSHFG